MATPKAELSEAFIFRPSHGGDPGPWLFQHLDKQQALQVANIQVELQKAVLAAQAKALDQVASVIKAAGQ